MVIKTNIAAQPAVMKLTQSSKLLSDSLAQLVAKPNLVPPLDDTVTTTEPADFETELARAIAAISHFHEETPFDRVQDDCLQQVNSALNRMGELATQARDVTMSSVDLARYHEEFETLAAYVNNVGALNFNGVNIFSGSEE
jgi:flagellin